MLKNKNLKKCLFLLAISACLALVGCFDLVERNYWRKGNYVVRDSPGSASCKTLYHNSDEALHGRVNYVSKIASNEKFILVESFENPSMDKKEYWILDVKKDKHLLNSNETVDGPYSLKEFNNKKDELGISQLELEEIP